MLDALDTFAAARLGDSPFWLRLPSAVWGAAAVFVLGEFALAYADRRRALLAALLLAVCLLHVDWSRRADFYALLSFLSIVQTAVFWRLLEKPKGWLGYAAVAALFLHAHPYAALIPGLHGLYAAVGFSGTRRREILASLAKAWLLAGLVGLPWFYFSTSTLMNKELFDLRGVPGTLTLGQFLLRIPLFLGQAPEAGPGREWAATPGAAASAAYFFFYLVSLSSIQRRPPLLRYCHWVLWAGTAAVAGLDLFYRYYFAHRQLLWLTPFYLLAVADGVVLCCELLPARPARTAWAAAGALACVSFLPLYLEVTRFQKEMNRRHEDIAEQVGRMVQPGDSLSFQNDLLLMGFLYSYSRDAFRACPGFALGVRGHLTFQTPEGMRARRGAADNAVFVGGAEGTGVWRFEGNLYDLTVRPPPRALSAPPRIGG